MKQLIYNGRNINTQPTDNKSSKLPFYEYLFSINTTLQFRSQNFYNNRHKQFASCISYHLYHFPMMLKQTKKEPSLAPFKLIIRF